MELTQKEIEWVKRMVAQEESLQLASIKNKQIEEARSLVAKKYEAQLLQLAEEGKVEERKALVEIMVAEADESELLITQS